MKDYASMSPAEQRTMQALARMPYLPNVGLYDPTDPSPEKLANTLELFADYLHNHVDEERRRDERLSELERDCAAVRRVFGTAPPVGVFSANRWDDGTLTARFSDVADAFEGKT